MTNAILYDILALKKKGAEKLNKYYINKNLYADTNEIESKVHTLLNRYGWVETSDGQEADLGISIGGDGTFIDTANSIRRGIDIIGINMGTLGYLAEIEPENVEEALDIYLSKRTDEYDFEDRMRIYGKCFYDNEAILRMDALNDIVISKNDSSVIGIEIVINGVKTADYLADGIIVSTPTGSTGYAFSCGAPIIDPCSNMMVITPIAPHSLINRSIVVDSYSRIEILLKSARGSETAKIACDGLTRNIKVGTKVIIGRSKSGDTRVVKFNNISFCDRIVQKMC